jgi:type IV pilus assembly protein PilB
VAAPAVALSTDRERLGELLVREGLVTREQLARALAEQQQAGGRLGYCLVKLGLVPEIELTKTLARQYRLPAVDLSRFEVDPRVLKLVPAELAMKHSVLPLKREGRTLTVAVVDPSNAGVVDDLKFITRYDIYPVVAGEFTLRTLVEKHYEAADQQAQSEMQSLLAEINGADGDIELLENTEDDGTGGLNAAAIDEAPVVRLVNAILTEAVKRGASDVHIECFEHEMRVRFRVDGALHEIMQPPMKLKSALISRLKILAASTSPSGACRRTGASSSRWGRRSSTSACRRSPRCSARRWCSASSTRGTSRSTSRRSASSRGPSASCSRRSATRTAWCSSPAPRARARPPRSTRRSPASTRAT